jgi:hypothetical protein
MEDRSYQEIREDDLESRRNDREDERRELTSREIRGITGKSLLTFIGGTITVIIAVVMTYSSIMEKLNDSQRSNADLQIKITMVEVSSKEILQRLQTNEIRISILEDHLKIDEKEKN